MDLLLGLCSLHFRFCSSPQPQGIGHLSCHAALEHCLRECSWAAHDYFKCYLGTGVHLLLAGIYNAVWLSDFHTLHVIHAPLQTSAGMANVHCIVTFIVFNMMLSGHKAPRLSAKLPRLHVRLHFRWLQIRDMLFLNAFLLPQVFLDGTHRASEYDWLIGYPDVFAACFFFWPGVWLLVVENANTDLEMRRHNWEAGGKQGKRPGYGSFDHFIISDLFTLLIYFVKALCWMQQCLCSCTL